ncbi:MAG: endoglucanase E [Asticcacaulis sp.]|nr:endoglucanase E [Asticcacaulis sp.]
MRFVVLTAALALLSAPVLAQGTAPELVPLPLHVGGRVFPQSPASQGYLHQWPGTYFEARFTGTTVTVRLKDDINVLNIWLDGQKVDVETKPGEGDIELGPLTDGEHTVRVEKITEVQGNSAQFVGFFVPSQANVLPAPPDRPRRIEFIGDSYTVGYGNTSPKHECPGDGVWAATDNSQAFGPLTAKAGNSLPRAYAFDVDQNGTTLTRPNDDWDPQVTVIYLGTNDFSTPLNAGEPWATRDAEHADYEATYIKFVQDLRAKHPGTSFILVATLQADGEFESEVKKVIAGLQTQGESRIAFLPVSSLSLTGCDWHPSTADDKAISDLLIAYIDQHPELWHGK